jgi:crotonobetainyl-CoA:carnitine CoA-transferase CaiB-like acyl-CoA transferase
VLHMDGYEGPRYDGVPSVGQHTAEVLAEAGLSTDEVQRLVSTGAISG